MHTDLADFEIWIASPEAATPGARYATRVVQSPAGPAVSEFTLDVNDAAFQQELTVVRSIDPALAARSTFGEKLFALLFAGDVERVWRESQGRVAGGQASGLRLRLWIEPSELALLPWELLCDPRDEAFLALTANAVMSRYLPVPEPPWLAAHEGLRILLVVESPQGLPAVSEDEVKTVQNALNNLGASVTVTTLRNPSMSVIQQALLDETHILHYLGHGAARRLVLTSPAGAPAPIADMEFAMAFRGRRSLRLVVLTACATSQAPLGTLFEGVGPSLIRAGLPAVVAMQYPTVQLETAGLFSAAFYGALAKGVALDVAVNEARQSIASGPLLDSRDWSTPVLYMGTRTGQILNLASSQSTEVDRSWDAVKAAAAASDVTKAALSDLTRRFQEVAAAHERLARLTELARHLRTVRRDFAPVARIVAAADGLGPRLQLQDLDRDWHALTDNGLAAIKALAAANPDVVSPRWYDPLLGAAKIVDDDLKRQALKPLANDTVTDFGSRLAESDAAVQADLDAAIGQLLALSARTLGRLTA